MFSMEPRLSKRQKIVQNDTNEQGRLSRLPNDVVARILSLLPPRDAFASRRLCKSWFLAWSSDPILDFVENDAVSLPEERRRFDTHGDLVGFADQTLAKLTDAELVRTLKLRLRMYGLRSLDRIESWLRFVKDRRVRVLDIDAVTNDIGYTLPRSVLAASSLTVLNLANLEVKISDSVSLDSLKNLSLNHVQFDDESARKLISGCPSLDRMDVSFCFGAKTLQVSNPSLRSLEVKQYYSASPRMRIAIEEATRLETMDYAGRGWKESGIGEGAMDRLRALRLHVMSLRDAAELEACIARLPRLETLRLGWRRGGERAIKIGGEGLRELVVDGMFQSVEVFVDAPNLVSLEYDKRFVTVTTLNSPKLLRALVRTS